MVIASQRLLSRLATSSSRRLAVSNARRVGVRALWGATPESIQGWKERGIIDDRALVSFETLHEMQVNACEVYSANNVFGTYTEASKSFEWMTYNEFGNKVNQCRSVLKDLGKSFSHAFVFYRGLSRSTVTGHFSSNPCFPRQMWGPVTRLESFLTTVGNGRRWLRLATVSTQILYPCMKHNFLRIGLTF